MAGRRSMLLVVVLSMLLAACGGGDGDAQGTPTPPGGTEDGELKAQSMILGDTAWFGGFKLTFESAAVVVGEVGGPRLDIVTLFENEGAANARLDATLNLAAGATNFVVNSSAQEVPEVPGKTQGRGTLSFTIDESFTFDDAVLTIGNPDNNQAVVPLGSTGTLVDLAPVAVTVTGFATGGELRFTAKGGEIRADIPETHAQVEAGRRALTLTFDITYLGDFAGGYAFGQNNLALTLPDGTTVAVDDGPIELLRAGTTLPDQEVRFIIRDPVAGSYGLIVIDDTIDQRGTLTFSLT